MPVNPSDKNCVKDEMSRFKSGEMHSGKGKKGEKGPVVKNRKQALAIALSACGKSKYVEHLQALGYSEEVATRTAEMLYKDLDWEKQFETGKAPGRELSKQPLGGYGKGLADLDIDSSPGKQRGNEGKQKDVEPEMISPVALPQGNPQSGPRSRQLSGLRMFSEDSIQKVNLMFEERVHSPDAGQCNQKQRREQRRAEQTPEQRQAAQERGARMRGRDNVSSAVRSEAAKKAAETRKRCKGGVSTPQAPIV